MLLKSSFSVGLLCRLGILIGCTLASRAAPATPQPASLPGSTAAAREVADQTQLCAQGDQSGCAQLGSRYLVGKGVAVDLRRAHTLLPRACEAGQPVACTNLGWAYGEGRGVAKDVAKSHALLQKACDLGGPRGCTLLGIEIANSSASDSLGAAARLLERAADLLDKACAQGKLASCGEQGNLYLFGVGVRRDPERGLGLLRKACAGDDFETCHNLGVLYRDGKLVDANPREAATLFDKSCQAGMLESCVNLGNLLDSGSTGARDGERAARLYAAVCQQGYALACYNLGLLYRRSGDGAEVQATAARYLEQACAATATTEMFGPGSALPTELSQSCQAGVAAACNGLGILTLADRCPARSPTQAAAHFTRACQLGEKAGCGNLGSLYLTGAGVAKDPVKARTLLGQACDGGSGVDCARLSRLYAQGLGGPKDGQRAAALLQRASQATDPVGHPSLPSPPPASVSPAGQVSPASPASQVSQVGQVSPAGQVSPVSQVGQAAVAETRHTTSSPGGQRCLPVVAARCGCVYTCGVGTAQADGSYRIRHAFWKDSELVGRVDRWCVKKECTDAFFAEIVCSGICAPKPADPTCHFTGPACGSDRPAP